MKRVLVAFDKFKDAITAIEACATARSAIESVSADRQISTAPLADGGDGFCDTLTKFLDGEICKQVVEGPTGEPAEAKFGLVPVSALNQETIDLLNLPETSRKIAIIEMAQSSGIALTPIYGRTPWNVSTYGLGQLLLSAIEKGADTAIVGLGGSATHDLGLGALQALGADFLDSQGEEITARPMPNSWKGIQQIRIPEVIPNLRLRIACDVSNALLGPKGAAAIFGPQKGMKAEEFAELDSLTADLAKLLVESSKLYHEIVDFPGSGAAGGTGIGLMAAFGGCFISGYELISAWIGLSEKLSSADIVITGEGGFDASSLGGKGPGSLALQAASQGKEVYVFAGKVGKFDTDQIKGIEINAISPEGVPLARLLHETKENLSKAIRNRFSLDKV